MTRGLASRANGARSRGPRTDEGKARSSLNALTHGLTARTAIVLPLVERAEDWSAHLTGFVEALRPVGAVERELVERMAAITWRLRRVERVEAAVIGGTLTAAARDAADASQPQDDDEADEFDERLRPTLDDLRGDAEQGVQRIAAHRRAWQADADAVLDEADVAVILADMGYGDGPYVELAPRAWTRVSLLAALDEAYGAEAVSTARLRAMNDHNDAIDRDADAQRRHAQLVAQRQIVWNGDTLERYEAHLSKQLALALATLRLVREA